MVSDLGMRIVLYELRMIPFGSLISVLILSHNGTMVKNLKCIIIYVGAAIIEIYHWWNKMEVEERLTKLKQAYANGKVRKEIYDENLAKLEAELAQLKKAEIEAAKEKQLDMVDCSVCGAPNLKSAIFCNECGMETGVKSEESIKKEEGMDDLLEDILQSEIIEDKKVDASLGLVSQSPVAEGEDEDDLLLDDLFDSLVLKEEEIECPLCGTSLPMGTQLCPNCDAQMTETGELVEEISFESLADSIEDGLSELEDMAEDLALDDEVGEELDDLSDIMGSVDTEIPQAEKVAIAEPAPEPVTPKPMAKTKRVVKSKSVAKTKSAAKPKPAVQKSEPTPIEEDIDVVPGDIDEEKVSKLHLIGMRVIDLIVIITLIGLIGVFLGFKLYYIENFNSMSTGLFFGVALGGMLATFILFRMNTSAVAEGDRLFKAGKYEEALGYYERACKLSNKPATAWTSKGVTLKRLGDHGGALRSHNIAIKLNPKNEIAWSNKGDLLFRLNKHDEALECYENALDLNSRYAIAWNNKGTTLARMGRYEEAKVCQDMATRLRPRYAAAWVNKGEILANLGRRDEAIVCYKRAKKLIAA